MAIQDNVGFEFLGIPKNILPKEFAGGVLENLDLMLQQDEAKMTNRLLDSQEERGLFRSGQTRQQLQEEILEPGIARRRGGLLDLVGQGLGQAREERLGDTAFQRQRQFATEDFDRRMKEMEQSLQNQQDLLRLQAALGIGMPAQQKKGGFFETLSNSLASGFGQGLGGRLGGR
jgi:hypothetical protein